MAHGFINRGRNTTFATRKELAWHKLGKVVDAMTSKEAVQLGGMDFEVGLAPIYAGVAPVQITETFNCQNIIRQGIGEDLSFYDATKLKSNFATYRKDTNHVFGVVGARYEPIQNIEAFDFFDEVIGKGNASYETVGALGNGEKVFITAKLPNKLIVGKENIDKYLLLTMAHDGSGSIQIMFTPIRVVCNNTLSAAVTNASNKVSIRHTKNARTRLQLSKQILGIADNQSIYLEERFNAFTRLQLNDEDMEAIFRKSFSMQVDERGKLSTRSNNILLDLKKYHAIGIGQEGIRGTGWGVYNAVTGYQQNIANYRSTDSEFESITGKHAASIRQKAFNEILQLI